MMDMLEITALRTKTHIGVHAWEQRILQELVLDIHIPMDCTQCTDNLANTIPMARNIAEVEKRRWR